MSYKESLMRCVRCAHLKSVTPIRMRCTKYDVIISTNNHPPEVCEHFDNSLPRTRLYINECAACGKWTIYGCTDRARCSRECANNRLVTRDPIRTGAPIHVCCVCGEVIYPVGRRVAVCRKNDCISTYFGFDRPLTGKYGSEEWIESFTIGYIHSAAAAGTHVAAKEIKGALDRIGYKVSTVDVKKIPASMKKCGLPVIKSSHDGLRVIKSFETLEVVKDGSN